METKILSHKSQTDPNKHVVMAGTHPLPILISGSGSNVLLERVPLTGASGTSAYDEDWLQDLLYNHPESLPVAELNPSFVGLIPICRELLTPAGPIDVLYATREGRIAVLEAKLWRNPEARRKVIGQILDYAKELSNWTYETLDAAVLLEDQAAIDEAIGQPVKWYSTDNWQGIAIWREFGDQMLTQQRAEVQAWLGDVVNRFVNAFRPRIEAVLRDQ